MESMGLKLKLARTRSGLSQIEVIAKLQQEGINITQPYLSMIEKDKREPNLGQLKVFAKIYDIDVLELLFTQKELEELLNKSK